MNKVKVTIKANNGKTATLSFPMDREEFKTAMCNLAGDTPGIYWWFDEFLVFSSTEGRCLMRGKNLSEMNLYGEYISKMDDDDLGMYVFLLDAFDKDVTSVCDLINISANIENYYFVKNINSYLDLGRYLAEHDSDFADLDDKVLRSLGKKYVKQNQGKIHGGYYIQRCPKSWKTVYNGNPNMIPEQYQLCSDTNEGGN